jgi:hypothetical protein
VDPVFFLVHEDELGRQGIKHLRRAQVAQVLDKLLDVEAVEDADRQ